jgi:hypothetical protein
MTATGMEFGVYPEPAALRQQTGLPIAGYWSGSGTPPYPTDATGDCGNIRPEDFENIRDSLVRMREMVCSVPPELKDVASLQAWAVERIADLRTELNDVERGLAAGENWLVADHFANMAADFTDIMSNIGLAPEQYGFDDAGFKKASDEEPDNDGPIGH